MYDLNYTFLTELEVDTRQSFDDLSDDLLLLDKNNGEESQVVDMKSEISSWQNYFWKSPNANKQNLDITFTDISIYRGTVTSTDWQGNPLNDLEMLSIEELERFFANIDNRRGWIGNRTWQELSNAVCDAITALQEKYVDVDNVYPVSSVIVSDRNPGSDFGTWVSKDKYYLSEIFTQSYYNVKPGHDDGTSKTLNDIELKSTASKPPSHTHQLQYTPISGGGKSEASGQCGSTKISWSNERKGTNRGAPGEYYTGYALPNDSVFPAVVKTDANSKVKDGDSKSPGFTVHKAKKDATDESIKVAPKTYPLSATIWEKTANVNG